MEKIENYETNPNVREVRAGDELLPRVAPNASAYGVCRNFRKEEYYAHQSIAYRIDGDSKQERLLFGIKNAVTAGDPIAYVYVTDMALKIKASNPLNKAYHINDMILSVNNATVIIAPSGGNKDQGKSILREYRYSDVSSPFLLPDVINPIRERDLTHYFDGAPIDSLCKCTMQRQGVLKDGYLVKVGNRFVLFGADFIALESKTINDLQDLHGDKIISRTIEYYNGYIIQLNSGSTENAYINVFRWDDGSKVDTYRYSDTPGNLEAKGICSIGNGKYLYTLTKNAEIEVKLLDFNTPSHSHVLSDIFDFKTLKRYPGVLYVNPALEGNSYLTPDGSREKPFPNVAEAAAYGKLFLSEATILLMNGNYGTVELSHVPMGLTLKGLDKAACLVDQIRISNCVNLQLVSLTFCDGERPFEVSSSTIELNNCSFPNGKQSGPEATGSCGVRIAGNSTVTLKECEISRFDTAVDIRGSKLFFEGSKALRGTGNLYGIRGEKSIIRGAKDLTGKVFAVQGMSLTECQSDGDFTAVRDTNGAVRPSAPEKGEFYLDVEVNKPLWWNGSVWVDVAGKVY